MMEPLSNWKYINYYIALKIIGAAAEAGTVAVAAVVEVV